MSRQKEASRIRLTCEFKNNLVYISLGRMFFLTYTIPSFIGFLLHSHIFQHQSCVTSSEDWQITPDCVCSLFITHVTLVSCTLAHVSLIWVWIEVNSNWQLARVQSLSYRIISQYISPPKISLPWAIIQQVTNKAKRVQSVSLGLIFIQKIHHCSYFFSFYILCAAQSNLGPSFISLAA